MSDQSSNPAAMSDPASRLKSDPLLAEGMGEEESLGADAGAGNAGTSAAPENPLVSDATDVDDWDGVGMLGGAEEAELVPLEVVDVNDAANDNWDDNDDNAYNDSDDALPDDSEEAALKQDLLNSTERGRFGDGDTGDNPRTEDEER